MQSRHSYSLFPSESLRLISYCPLCNTHYNPMAAQIVEERDDAHLIHIECRKCGSSIVALIMSAGIGMSSVGLVTDLTGDEVGEVRRRESVHADDVLDVHQALNAPHSTFLRDLLAS